MGDRIGRARPVLPAVIVGTATALALTASGCSAGSTTSHAPSASAAPARGASAELPQGAWWTWASAEPERSNPVTDRTGESCARNQPDDVWFLAGTFAGTARRHCSVPADRPIVAPVVNLYSSHSPQDCADSMASASGRATLDGAPLQVERIDGEPVTFQAAPGNAVTGAPGRVSATACGSWVRMPPLPAGRHQLQIRGGSGGFTTGVDYELDVVDSSA